MFSNTLEKDKLKNKEINDIGNDFIVHNMPDAQRFSGQTFPNRQTSSKGKVISLKSDTKLADHHKVGIFIISGGFILIIALFYLAYIYMIKPVSETPEKIATELVLKKEEPKIEEVITPIVDIESAVSTSTEIVATSTVATSTEDLLPEEKNTTPVFNIVSTIDSDLDGLTDDEERIIGTDSNLADSDKDSFLDISELKSGYNPLLAGKKMDDKTTLNRYKIDSKSNILFLNSWSPTRSDTTNTVIFTDEDKSFIQLTSQENEEKLSGSLWYNKQFPGINPGEMISGESWNGFYSQDGAAAYIFSNDLSSIYNVSYSPLVENDLSLPLFRLMVKTMLIK